MRAGLLVLLLLVPLVAFGQAYNYTDQPFMVLTARATTVSPSYLVSDGFEETCTGGALGSATDGYDSSLITATNTPVNQDYSTSGLDLVGSQCLQVTAPGGSAYWQTGSTYSELHVYFQWRVPVWPGGFNPYICLISVSGDTQAAIRILSGGTVRIYNGGSFTPTVATLTDNTTYHFWLNWKTDGTASGGFTTDGSVPTGDNLASVAGGSGTTDANRVFLKADESGEVFYFDHLIVSDTTIGPNP